MALTAATSPMQLAQVFDRTVGSEQRAEQNKAARGTARLGQQHTTGSKSRVLVSVLAARPAPAPRSRSK